MSNEDTTQVEFYAPWPNLGKKFSQQLGEIRTDTATLSPLVRGMGLDSDGDFSTLDGLEKTVIQSREWGKHQFHNKFRMHYDKTNDLFDIAYNTGTEEVPNWYTTWTIDKDGHVSQQNTPTTASNLGSGAGWFKQKSGVDLEFKSITATSPITITAGANSIDVDGSTLVTDYSSLGGDKSLITSKSATILPFKGLSAGPNVVLTSSGTDIQIESTAQVVEFYGIVVQHHDGSVVYPKVHVLKVHTDAFYLTQKKTNPSAAEVILNFRGETLESSSFVAVIGDEMTGPLLQADGSIGAPSFAFTSDDDTGLFLNAVADLAITVAGSSRLRILDTAILSTEPFQIASGADVSNPDYAFFTDTNTGLYQLTANDGSIAFSANGVTGGAIVANSGAPVMQMPDGAVGTPQYSFSADSNTGMYRKTTDQLAFATEGLIAAYFDEKQNLLHAGQFGTSGAPAYSFADDEDTGIYRRGINELGFATAGSERGYISTGGALVWAGTITAKAGSAAFPSFNFVGDTTSGMYRIADNNFGFSSDGVSIFNYTKTAVNMGTDIPLVLYGTGPDPADDTAPALIGTYATNTGIWFANATAVQFTTSGNRIFIMAEDNVSFRQQFRSATEFVLGTESAPDYSFFPDTDTGMFSLSENNLAFTTGGTLAGFFTGTQEFYVVGNVHVPDEAYSSTTWQGDHTVPTKNAVRDKIESIVIDGGTSTTFYGGITVEGGITSTGIVRAEAFYLGLHNSGISNDDSGNLLIDSGANNVHINPNTELEVLGDIVSEGLTWTSRTSTADNSWRSVTYGNGIFVAVSFTGSSDRVMTSPDGINWTTRINPVDNDWRSVTYGNGLFVAVASSGTNDRVMTSPDGINWTIRTTPTSNNWLSVTYGNGLFVAISTTGTDNRVMTSPDGINWTIRTSAANNAWRSVTYGNGLFVAVTSEGVGGDRVMTSPDGITWTSRTHSVDNQWFSVTYGNGLFVAVSNTGTNDRVMTSPDGITWTTRTSPEDNKWLSVIYGSGLFVAVATDGTGNGVMTSPDGINWTIRTSAADNSWIGVTYGNGMFVAVANTGTGDRIMTSGKTKLNEVSTNNIFQGGIEVRNDLIVIGDVNTSRVEAGLGVFYTQLNADRIVLDRNGSLTEPALAFAGNPDTGLFLNSTNDFQIIQNGVSFLRFTSGRFIPNSPVRAENAGTFALPAYTWNDDPNTGIYQTSSGNNTISFSTDGIRAGNFDSSQDLLLRNNLKLESGGQIFVDDGTSSNPSYTFTNDINTGLFSVSDDTIAMVTNSSTKMEWTSSVINFNRPLLANIDEGGAADPEYSFQGDTDTGMWSRGGLPNSIHFATGGIDAGYFSAHQDFYVTNRVFVADEAYTRGGWTRDFSVPTKNAVSDIIVELESNRFYLTVKQSDGLQSFSGLNVLNFNVDNFYLTQNTPNTDEVMINFRGLIGAESVTAGTFRSGIFKFLDRVEQEISIDNTVFGLNAASSMATDGSAFSNTIIGSSAGAGLGGKDRNTIIGAFAGSVLNEDDNTMIGANAGKNSTGSSNTYIGSSAGENVTSGNSSVIIGKDAGLNATSSGGAVILGEQAGQETVDNIVAIGRLAGQLCTNESNVFIGKESGKNVTSGGGNTLIGFGAALLLATGSNNTCIGGSIAGSLTGTSNTLIGSKAGDAVTSGDGNTMIGANAGDSVDVGINNTCVGNAAGAGGNFSTVVAFGYRAGQSATGGAGTLVGAEAGKVSTGFNNTFIGASAGILITSGASNTAVGGSAMATNVTGSFNTIVGTRALRFANVDSDDNIAIGYESSGGAVGERERNTTIGRGSGRGLTTADDNVIIGYLAGDAVTTGGESTLIGNYSGSALATSDARNVFLGFSSGRFQTGVSDKLIIDNRSQSDAASELTDALVVGDFSATVASQNITFNANTTITHSLVGTPDAITATSTGVAASLTTINTEVTTNDDNDLDNVTLADGTAGQIKHIYCVASFAGDTWKITPATFLEGTQITFGDNSVGTGCTLVFAATVGWIVVGNNGGTIA